MRNLSMSAVDDSEYRRCRVLHVVPLTFIYGFIKVAFHAVLLVLICTLLMRPELLDKHEENDKMYGCLCLAKLSRHHNHIGFIDKKPLETKDLAYVLGLKKLPLKSNSNKMAKIEMEKKSIIRERQIGQLYWSLLMTLFYMLFSLMLLHGIMNNNAPNMLPFFCLQLFDFALDFLWFFGHFISTKSLHQLQQALKCLPLGKHFQSLDPGVASFLVFAICLTVLMVQIYLICVVWSCYRYILARRCQLIPSYRTSSNSSHRNGFWGLELWQVILSPRNSLRKKRLPKELEEGQIEQLPNYDEVLKTPINSFNPPPYSGNDDAKAEKEKLKKQDETNGNDQ